MRIIQISDLHIGGLFKQSAFDTFVSEVNNDLNPDPIIVSGDLTDDGLIFQFEKASPTRAARKEIHRTDPSGAYTNLVDLILEKKSVDK